MERFVVLYNQVAGRTSKKQDTRDNKVEKKMVQVLINLCDSHVTKNEKVKGVNSHKLNIIFTSPLAFLLHKLTQ
jgi:hypothetical protein